MECFILLNQNSFHYATCFQRMPSYIGLSKSFCRASYGSIALWTGILGASTVVCNAIDQNERDRTSKFRDKSKMFGGHVKEGEAPSWGNPYKPWMA